MNAMISKFEITLVFGCYDHSPLQRSSFLRYFSFMKTLEELPVYLATIGSLIPIMVFL
ncbi:hypothetical protein MPTK1_4g07460 [Marchantia polymorpha subsp. ruderalis]|uniref:Uncharacterized protein n=2 Tax=Marchantia polymorpha TaxID=3197 RepID=A0AAF6B7F2_MARPO|nr:hypothetical protein MARPO_0115s0035 [Marchantia polymorpha]BBN07936.1 hypothetical protein Mp_4g07460 [Marchantia polymorpha subsp. ruderalis]|eukprot:PTQ31118.1 hypothetical protein MARPO_0115s0035 [Marchantia polymorpha]